MLSKLLKYDYRWINKTMYIYFIILFVISIFLKIVNNLDQTFFIMILDRIMFSLFISAIITVIINLMMRVWARITTNLYRDESYLTHTLPVEKSKLYDAKVIAMILSTLLSLLVIVLCFALVYLDKTGITYIKDMYNTSVDLSTNWLWLVSQYLKNLKKRRNMNGTINAKRPLRKSKIISKVH